jgi:hypothetical protein
MELLLIIGAYSCTPFECFSMSSNVCARKSNSTIMVNSVPCDSGKACLGSDLLSIDNNSTEILECMSQADEPVYDWTMIAYECGTRNAHKEFISNKTIVSCLNDTDCLLIDGNYTTCECGTDGKKYCIPSWDSSAFDSYWNECANGLTHRQLVFWILYKEYYSIWVTMGNLDCLSTTIYEINIMNSTNPTAISQGLYYVINFSITIVFLFI